MLEKEIIFARCKYYWDAHNTHQLWADMAQDDEDWETYDEENYNASHLLSQFAALCELIRELGYMDEYIEWRKGK